MKTLRCLSLTVFLSLAACAHQRPEAEPWGPVPSLPPPDQAQVLARSEPDARRAADLAWIAANDPKLAREILDRAIAADPRDASLYLRRYQLSVSELNERAAYSDLLEVLRVDEEGAAAELALGLLLEARESASMLAPAAITAALDGAPSLRVRPSPAQQVLAARLRARNTRFEARTTGAALQAEERAHLARAGALTRFRSRGPLQPYLYASFDRPGPWEPTTRQLGAETPLPPAAFEREIPMLGGLIDPAKGQAPGLYVLDVFVRVSSPGPTRIRLLADLRAQARVRWNGALLLERFELDLDLPTVQEARVELAPGWHHLVVASLSTPRSGVALHLFAEDGSPLDFEESLTLPNDTPLAASLVLERPDPRREAILRTAEALRSPPDSAEVRAWVGQEALGLWRRDLELARSAVLPVARGAESSAVFTVLEARVMQQDGQPRALVEAKFRRALALAPNTPSLLLVVAAATSGDDPDRALALIDELRPLAPEASAPDELAFHIHDRRGWKHEAESALAAAEAKGPSPSFLEAAARYLRSQFRLADAEEREEAARRLRSARPRRNRVKEALESGDPERAVSLLEKAVPRSADPSSTWARIAEIELMRGRFEPARRAGVQVLELAPWSPAGPELAAAALLGAKRRPEARAELRRLQSTGFEDAEVEELRAYLEGRVPGEPSPGSKLAARLAVDPIELAKAPVEARFRGFREVRLLDRVVDYVRPTGQSISLRHSLFRLETKEATDRAGEFQLPERAIGLELRTLKSDGRIVEVDEHEGKADLSFSALAPGDSVERKWVVAEGPATPMGGYSRFFFFRDDVPIRRSELFVVVPRGTAIVWQAHHGAPEPEIFEDGEHTVYLFSRRDIPGMRLEPASAPYPEYVPFVVVTLGLDEATARRSNRSGALGADRSSFEVNEKALALIAGETNPRAQVERIFRFVADEIRQGPARAPTLTLSLGRGNRVFLLSALLKAAGLDAELVLARSGDEAWTEPPYPDPGFYSHPLVRIRLPSSQEPLFADLGGTQTSRGMGTWLGRAPRRFRGGRYIVVRDPEATPVPFLEQEVETNATTTQVTLELRSNGDAEGSVVIDVPGGPGAMIKDALRNLQDRELRQSLQGMFANTVPGGEVRAFELVGMDDRLAKLSIRLEVVVHRLLAAENGGMVANRFFPRPISGLLAGLPPFEQLIQVPRRESPMRLTDAAETLTVTLRLPEGTPAPTDMPVSFERRERWGRMRQATTHVGNELRFEREIELSSARVLPAEYDHFYAFIQDLALRMKGQLRFERNPPSAEAR